MNRIQKVENSFFRQLLFLLALIVMGIVIWKQLGSLLSSFLGAFTLYIVLRSPLFYFTEKRKKRWKAWLASLLLIFIVLISFAGFGFLIFEIIAKEAPAISTTLIIDKYYLVVDKVNKLVGYELITTNLIMEMRGIITNIGSDLVSGLFNTTYNLIINSVLMIFVLFFMLSNARKMEAAIVHYLPFRGDSLVMIKKEVKNMIYSNAIGIPVIMIAQGLVACLGYWLIGIDKIFFWAFLTAIAGLIPVVGTAVIWMPLGIYMIVSGNIWQGIIILLYGLIFIVNADNACRLILMKKMANVHPLIVVFGVILGIPLFGFWGIIFGPLLISGFLLLIRIYFMEYYGKKLEDDDPFKNNK